MYTEYLLKLMFLNCQEPSKVALPGGKVVQVDYSDTESLKNLLQGVDTVLSFVVVHLDPDGTAQKNLIDASIAAGVRRFAPSEWGM